MNGGNILDQRVKRAFKLGDKSDLRCQDQDLLILGQNIPDHFLVDPRFSGSGDTFEDGNVKPLGKIGFPGIENYFLVFGQRKKVGFRIVRIPAGGVVQVVFVRECNRSGQLDRKCIPDEKTQR